MIIVIAAHPFYDMKEFAKSLALRFGTNFQDIDKLSLTKNAGLFHNPPSKNAVYEGSVFAHKFEGDVARVYVKWSDEFLVKQAMDSGISFEDANKNVESAFNDEAEYLKKFFDVDIKDLGVYDLVVSADRLDIDGLISVIERYINKIKK